MIQRYRLNRTSVTNKKRIVSFSAEVQQGNCSVFIHTMTNGGHDWHPRVVIQSGGGTGWWCWYRVGTNYSHLLSHDDLRVTERQEVDQGSTRRRRTGEGGQWIKKKGRL